MDVFLAVLVFCFLFNSNECTGQEGGSGFTCVRMSSAALIKRFIIKPRRYDIEHMGYNGYYRGWADVQGQGAANDFCRFVERARTLSLACALAGTNGESDLNYISSWKIDPGMKNTWYMKDEDGDGRDDYCRCVKNKTNISSQVLCTKAGSIGFYGSDKQKGEELTFTVGNSNDCHNRTVRPEFGKETSL